MAIALALLLSDERQKLGNIHLLGLLGNVSGVTALQGACLLQHRGKNILQLFSAERASAGIIPLGDLSQSISRSKSNRGAGSLPPQPAQQTPRQSACEAADKSS